MSRGLGPLQRRILVSIAAIAEGQEQGADVFDVLTLWSHLDGKPRQAFDRANLHRALHTLAARGLLSYTDDADYTPRCVCYHEPADHHAGVGWCRPCFARRGRYHQYRPRPTPRPRWRMRLTPAGQRFVSEEEKAPIIEQWQAFRQERLETLTRLEAYVK
jgi:hypothetical protein